MGTVATLWRHPIKSHGREQLDAVTLTAGRAMPWDRHWAVTHDRTKYNAANPGWMWCRNFMIGNMNPGLMGLWAQLDEAAGMITLRHAHLGEITFSPDVDVDVARFIAWVLPICPEGRLVPTGVIHAGVAMTDSDFPSVSIMTHASLAGVSDAAGVTLDEERFRGNIWVDGFKAWAENDWIGRTVQIGAAQLHVRERIERCGVPGTDPIAGKRDIDVLRILRDNWGHKDFGVYAVVTKSGAIRPGDEVRVLQ